MSLYEQPVPGQNQPHIDLEKSQPQVAELR